METQLGQDIVPFLDAKRFQRDHRGRFELDPSDIRFTSETLHLTASDVSAINTFVDLRFLFSEHGYNPRDYEVIWEAISACDPARTRIIVEGIWGWGEPGQEVKTSPENQAHLSKRRQDYLDYAAAGGGRADRTFNHAYNFARVAAKSRGIPIICPDFTPLERKWWEEAQLAAGNENLREWSSYFDSVFDEITALPFIEAVSEYTQLFHRVNAYHGSVLMYNFPEYLAQRDRFGLNIIRYCALQDARRAMADPDEVQRVTRAENPDPKRTLLVLYGSDHSRPMQTELRREQIRFTATTYPYRNTSDYRPEPIDGPAARSFMIEFFNHHAFRNEWKAPNEYTDLVMRSLIAITEESPLEVLRDIFELSRAGYINASSETALSYLDLLFELFPHIKGGQHPLLSLPNPAQKQ